MLLSGEPGIGKSRLVQALKEQVSAEGATRIEFRCSPYHQNSALYPIIDHLQRLLQFAREDTPQAKLTKLQQALALSFPPGGDPAAVSYSALASSSRGAPPITLSPQRQKQKTQEALVAWLRRKQRAALCIVRGKICTGSIPRRWRCSPSSWSRSPPPGCLPC